MDTVMGLVGWAILVALPFAIVRREMEERYAPILARWQRTLEEVNDRVRIVALRVVGEPETWTRVGRTDALDPRYAYGVPRMYENQPGTLVDENGRPVRLGSEVTLSATVRFRTQPAPRREEHVEFGEHDGYATEWVSIESGTRLYARARVEPGDGVDILCRRSPRAIRIESAPGDPVPAAVPPLPPSYAVVVPALVAVVVELPGIVASALGAFRAGLALALAGVLGTALVSLFVLPRIRAAKLRAQISSDQPSGGTTT